MNINERQFLQELREAAESREKQVLNPHWKYAYIELAMAADRCDAIIARGAATEEQPCASNV